MRKKIWILNHYAGNMFFDKAGRHFWFAKELVKRGYEPVIICASFLHNSDGIQVIEDDTKIKLEETDGIKFVFLKTSAYIGNGKARLKNMIEYTSAVIKERKEISRLVGKPDVVWGSSVHPLAVYAGIRLGKKFHCKTIGEIRDLWPETLIMFGKLKPEGFITKCMYAGEKWLYKKCDDMIFTMEGGPQYIKDMGWENAIPMEKCHYINNGIDLKQFDERVKDAFFDEHLDDDKYKLVYTGTIALYNAVDKIIDAAELLKKNHPECADRIEILIYGRGTDEQLIKDMCKERNIDNVVIKGFVKKQQIPYVLSKCNCNLVNYATEVPCPEHDVFKYGNSGNKFFEYLASGNPVIFALPCAYSIVEHYDCGIVLSDDSTASALAEAIVEVYNWDASKYATVRDNARKGAKDFDFEKLADKLIQVIER